MRASLFLKIAAVLTAVLVIFLTASCSVPGVESEEETTTERPAVLLEDRPESPAQILDFYNRAVNAIKADKPGVRSSFEASVHDVNTGDCAEAEALIEFAQNYSDALEEIEDQKEYGSDLNDFLPLAGTDTVSRLTADNIESAELSDVEDDLYAYDLHIVLKDGGKDGAVAAAFDFYPEKEAEILPTFSNYNSLIEVSEYDVAYNGCEIFARINKETNRVMNLHLVKKCLVSTTVNFTGALAAMGETDVSFTLQEDIEFYDFVWDQPTETETAA